jgi:DNA-directed RNA polymerase subunit RPC12/RpoP
MAHFLICTRLYWFQCMTCHMRSILQTQSKANRNVFCEPCGHKPMKENSRLSVEIKRIEPTQSNREGHWLIEYYGRKTVLDTT